mgnify:CR=1 FL=1
MSNLNMTADEIIKTAQTFRDFIEQYAYMLDDEQALDIPNAYPTWSGAGVEYKKGARVRYDGQLYRTLQDHTSQATWTPTDAPSLFALVLIVDEDEPEPWKQPDSTNAYMSGDIVIFDGKQYMSIIDNNVWSPMEYPAGWQVVV